jgi:hypothetical protein
MTMQERVFDADHSHIQNRKSNIQLIATDIDGTLLDSANQLPAANRRALVAALERGVRLALVTARKQASTLAVAQLLDLPCACIAHNGARVWDWNGTELRHLTIPMPDARRIAALADEQDVPLILTVNEVNYYSPAYPFDTSLGIASEQPVERCVDALHAPPTRIIVAGERGITLLGDMLGRAPEQIVLHRYYNRDNTLESAVITHPHATKESALALLAEQIGVTAGDVLTLGDAEADAGMLRWAGVGVAMGNAMPEAHAAADWIAPDHDDAGFAVAIKRFVLNEG